MSDLMLLGVLQMPIDMVMADVPSTIQYIQRGHEAAERIKADALALEAANARIAELERVSSGDRGQKEIWEQRAKEWSDRAHQLESQIAAAEKQEPVATDSSLSKTIARIRSKLPQPHVIDPFMMDVGRLCVMAEMQDATPFNLKESEQYIGQMAGISTAAMGYWTEGDSIHPDLDTVALRDVAKLYAKYADLFASAKVPQTRLTYEQSAAIEYAADLIDEKWGVPMKAASVLRALIAAPLPSDGKDAERLIELIADDAYAMTFQSLGQYRASLLRAAKEQIAALAKQQLEG